MALPRHAVFVTQFAPQSVGHGGDHRAFQIAHDLRAALGADNVSIVSLPALGTRPPPRLRARLRENPLRLLRPARVSRPFSDPQLLAHYDALVKGLPRPCVCVTEHAAFADLVKRNRCLRIPTLASIANLESLDKSQADPRDRLSLAATALDLANEVHALALCDERLFISRVETALVGGLGLSAHYYPYMPVGEIRARLEAIRRRREATPPETDLCIALGSASHQTTFDALRRFAAGARRGGLPPGLRVELVGKRTEKVLADGERVPGIVARGWLAQDALDDLLARAAFVVAPQYSGFGALTRLPELSCAGIPVLVSRHAAHALALPPGAAVVDDEWEAWHDAMDAMVRAPSPAPAGAYDAWAQAQPAPLAALLARHGAN